MKQYNRRNKFIFKRSVVLLLSLAAALVSVCAAGAVAAEQTRSEACGVDWSTLHSYGDGQLERTRIEVRSEDGVNTLVLPASVSRSAVTLCWDCPSSVAVTVSGSAGVTQWVSGEALDLTKLCNEGDDTLSFLAPTDEGLSQYELNILFSEHVSAMYLLSDDPENEGRVWVESSQDKSNKATGTMVMQKADGTVVYDDALTQIKGRGNSTWKADKKPYQIKLASKTDLLETGNKDNKSKTWVLLANYYDPALLRNTLMLNLGSALGMEAGIESTHVDLYYDGEYRGSYLLAEKVELGDGRVNITDLEEVNETANPEVDIEAFPISVATTANGATYTYCEGMTSPEDITGGYLLEMDLGVRAVEEVSYFYTKRGEYVVVKSPEYASKEEMEYIATLYQEYEDAVYNGGVHPETGKAYTDYVDLKSTVQYYLVNEFSKNRDAFHSSTYLYKEAGSDVMTMGPLWDYDLCLGKGGGESLMEDMLPEGISVAASGFGAALMKLEDFRAAAKEMYENEFYPLILNVMLGDMDAVSQDGSLRALDYYAAQIAGAAQCNALLWGTDEEWAASVEYLNDFMGRRLEWLKEHFDQMSAESDLTMSKYIDVFASDWFYEDVYKAAQYGLMFGSGGDTFDAGSHVQRAHVAQALYRMAGEPLAAYEQKYSDVSPTDWFGNGVTWASNTGIINGYPDGTFKPTDVITREDLAVLLYRYAGQPEVETGTLEQFPDREDVSAYAYNAVVWAVNEGLIKGNGDGTILPRGVATRAELAVILVRFYEGLNGLAQPEPTDPGMTEEEPAGPEPETVQPEPEEPESPLPEENISGANGSEGADGSQPDAEAKGEMDYAVG